MLTIAVACSGASTGGVRPAGGAGPTGPMGAGPDPAIEAPPDEPHHAAPPPPAVTGDAAALVAAHDEVRAKHCAPPLTWSVELARVAQAWADHLRDGGCLFEHSRTEYGENLAAGTEGALDPSSVVGMWYGEISKYDFRRGGFSMETGHFTQVVW